MTCRSFEIGSREYDDALRLREDILRKPLGLKITVPDLIADSSCYHLGGFDDALLVAVLLLQPLDENTLKMRQVAVTHNLQMSGVGTKLISFAEQFARQQGYSVMVAHARATALGFYLKLGYAASADEFIEMTVPHRLVTKML